MGKFWLRLLPEECQDFPEKNGVVPAKEPETLQERWHLEGRGQDSPRSTAVPVDRECRGNGDWLRTSSLEERRHLAALLQEGEEGQWLEARLRWEGEWRGRSLRVCTSKEAFGVGLVVFCFKARRGENSLIGCRNGAKRVSMLFSNTDTSQGGVLEGTWLVGDWEASLRLKVCHGYEIHRGVYFVFKLLSLVV